MEVSQKALTAALGTMIATPAFAQPDAWSLLKGIEIEEIVTETSYEVRKSFPNGFDQTIQDFEITGYAVPYALGAESKDLILVSDMGFCPFCGDPEHGVSLQITLAEPMMFEDETTRIRLRGTLQRVDDSQTWQAAILENAVVLD